MYKQHALLKVMKINFTKATSISEINELCDKLIAKYKCAHLGSGSFGSVYQHPEPNKVIKVSSNRDAYYMFARWCMEPEQLKNPHLPVVYEEQFYQIDKTQYFVHVIEKLTTPSIESLTRSPDYACDIHNSVIAALWSAGLKICQNSSSCGQFNSSHPTKTSFMKELLVVSKERHIYDSSRDPRALSIKDLGLEINFINTMFDIFSSCSAVGKLDFHGGNIMLRQTAGKRQGRGTLVITDPVASFHAAFVKKTHSTGFDTLQFTTTVKNEYSTWSAAIVPGIDYGNSNIQFNVHETDHVGSFKKKTIDQYFQPTV